MIHVPIRATMLPEENPMARDVVSQDAQPVGITVDEAAEILSRGDGPSFSQQVDEERGPKG
jgi:hypothetical protein